MTGAQSSQSSQSSHAPTRARRLHHREDNPAITATGPLPVGAPRKAPMLTTSRLVAAVAPLALAAGWTLAAITAPTTTGTGNLPFAEQAQKAPTPPVARTETPATAAPLPRRQDTPRAHSAHRTQEAPPATTPDPTPPHSPTGTGHANDHHVVDDEQAEPPIHTVAPTPPSGPDPQNLPPSCPGLDARCYRPNQP